MGIIEIILLFVLGLVIGVPASLVGVGGGFLIMPALIFFFGLPAQNAVAVSLAAICGTTISASLVYLKQKKVDFFLALLYDVFDIPGVILGAYLASLITSNLLTGLVGVFIISLSIMLMVRKDKDPVELKSSSAKVSNENKGWIRKRIDSEQGSVVISGDVTALPIDSTVRTRSYSSNNNLRDFAKGTDVYVMDADIVHATPEEIGRAAKDSGAKIAVMTHIQNPGFRVPKPPNISDTFKDLVQPDYDVFKKQISEFYSGEILIAEDFLTLEV